MSEPLLEVRGLKKYFAVGGLFWAEGGAGSRRSMG